MELCWQVLEVTNRVQLQNLHVPLPNLEPLRLLGDRLLKVSYLGILEVDGLPRPPRKAAQRGLIWAQQRSARVATLHSSEILGMRLPASTAPSASV